MFKSGYVSIVGKPNAGKSTLLNKLVGVKVAITTPKPQTTRFNIKGIVTSKTSQIVFIDTPGVHTPKHKMGNYMMKSVEMAISNVDVIIYLVDSTKPRIDYVTENIMKNIASLNTKVILCINKIDKIEKQNILKIIDEYNTFFESIGAKFADIIPISVYKNDGLDTLLLNIEKYLKEGEAIYPEDEITDITEREIVEETIREKALNNLEEEVPHGIKVEVENFKETVTEEGKFVYNIDVNLICNKKSHKGIIIGKDGSMLKKITNEARRDLENNLDAKIKLKIWVKSRENWQQNENFLNNIKSKI